MTQTYFQKGFGLKREVSPQIVENYHSALLDHLKALGREATVGDLHVKLARELGFCYGVDRAVEYAYQTRQRFPSKRIFLSGEIIHNPEVNRRLREMDIVILPVATDPAARYARVKADDVVILPAFGVSVAEREVLTRRGSVLVDTTCGSVLNVWKMVHRCARDGFTVVIHGKPAHEETRATASQALAHEGGRYVCVRYVADAELVCGFLRGSVSANALRERLGSSWSPGFDPERDLQRIGLANQTTMLKGESLEIQERLRAAMRDRYGEAALGERFRAFDTICSATQDRQDAVRDLVDEGGLDAMLVVGGYNSSNTQALANMCRARVPTYHIEGPACLTSRDISHHLAGGAAETRTADWLPSGKVTLGLTAGASTPDRVVGAVLEQLLALRGYAATDLTAIPAQREVLDVAGSAS